jgi:CyaY protein
MDESLFDRIADVELSDLEKRLSELDPDELEVELSMGVLTLTFADDSKMVINSHRAARQIWMAADRQAWHFSPQSEGAAWRWRTERDELHATIVRLLSQKLGHAVTV